MKKYAPEGVDIYYDNVGGETLDAVLENAKDFARFIECGMISQYNLTDKKDIYGVKNLLLVIPKRITIRVSFLGEEWVDEERVLTRDQGFIVGDPGMGSKYTKEHQENVSKWLSTGELVYRVDVTNGIDSALEGFVGMLQGKNFGKAVLLVRYSISLCRFLNGTNIGWADRRYRVGDFRSEKYVY